MCVSCACHHCGICLVPPAVMVGRPHRFYLPLSMIVVARRFISLCPCNTAAGHMRHASAHLSGHACACQKCGTCLILPSVVVGRMHCLCLPSWLSCLMTYSILFHIVTATLLLATCGILLRTCCTCICRDMPALPGVWHLSGTAMSSGWVGRHCFCLPSPLFMLVRQCPEPGR
jgi:hypothetical protein